MSKPKKELINTRTEDLLVELDEKEIDLRAREMAKVAGQLNRARAELKMVASEHKSRIKKVEESFDKLAEAVREGRELRPVQVESWADYTKGSLTEIRQDNGETVSERALAPEERQVDHGGGASGPTPEKVAKQLFADGLRPDDSGIAEKIEEAAQAGGVEAAPVLDALVEMAEAEAEEKSRAN